MTPTRQ